MICYNLTVLVLVHMGDTSGEIFWRKHLKISDLQKKLLNMPFQIPWWNGFKWDVNLQTKILKFLIIQINKTYFPYVHNILMFALWLFVQSKKTDYCIC